MSRSPQSGTGNRRGLFPHPAFTLLAIVAVASFIALGRWQWDRGEHKTAQRAAFDQATAATEVTTLRELEQLPRYARIELTGTYDADHQFVLENLSHAGMPGYEVLTPLALQGGSGVVLVNRGWIRFTGYRDRQPDVGLDAAETVTVSGRIGELPVAGLASGRLAPPLEGPWPRSASFPSMEELGATLGRPLAPRVLLLGADEPHGYVREWSPPGLPAGRHYAYAVQWWSFAALVVGLYVLLTARRARKR